MQGSSASRRKQRPRWVGDRDMQLSWHLPLQLCVCSLCSAEQHSLAPLTPAYSPPPPSPTRLPHCQQKAERLQASLHLIGAPAANRHVVFVDDEAAAEQFDAAAHFDTAPELLDRAYNRPRLAQLADARATTAGEGAAVAVARLEK